MPTLFYLKFFCPKTTFGSVGQCLHRGHTAVCTHRTRPTATGSSYSKHGPQQPETHYSRKTVAAHKENDNIYFVFEQNFFLSLSLFCSVLEKVKRGTFIGGNTRNVHFSIKWIGDLCTDLDGAQVSASSQCDHEIECIESKTKDKNVSEYFVRQFF